MRIFISIFGICPHMLLKDREESQDKLTKALSNAAASITGVSLRQVCSYCTCHDQKFQAMKTRASSQNNVQKSAR